jgi:endonuclease/exonuclease/phosphatase (EEP) superfamily protein YafD
MFIALIIVSVLFLATAVAPLLPSQHWTVRVWEFPRVQQAVLLLICLAGWGIHVEQQPIIGSIFILLLTAALIWHLTWIFPYTFLASKEVKSSTLKDDDHTLSILGSNVYMHNKNSKGLCDLANEYQPDMLVTLESNGWWEEALTVLHDNYPYRVACPLDNLYGIHVYSRLPFIENDVRFLVEDDVPSIEVIVKIGDQKVKIYLLHPKPPSPSENKSARPRDHELHIIGREAKESELPVIVAGDLNDVAWSPTTRKFRKISGLLDPRIGRGFFNTFHANYPLLKWPLDHIFHSADFELVKIQKLASYGSDHYPLYTKLKLKTYRSDISS